MSANVAIPVAGFKDVYSVADVDKALQELTPSASEALRTLYEKMLRVGGQRFTVKPSSMPQMDELFDRRLAPQRRGGFSPEADVYYTPDPRGAVVPGGTPLSRPASGSRSWARRRGGRRTCRTPP